MATRVCRDLQPPDATYDDHMACSRRAETFADAFEPLLAILTLKDLPRTATIAFAPLLLGWLAAYALVGIGRWVRAGFKRS